MAKKAKPEKAKDNSPFVHQRDVLKTTFDIRELKWTDKQKSFIDLAGDKHSQIVFVKGCAGTSKTSLAIYCLLDFLRTKRVTDLIMIRSIVESSDNKMGYLPGSASEKLCPYLAPFFDKFDMFISNPVLAALQKDDRITAFPVSFLRGLDWNRKGIVLDEAQNMSRKELLTFMTRIGKFNKTFIVGDPDQSDIKNSGFSEIYDLFNCEESRGKGIHCVEFGQEDVMRSELCRYIAAKFEELKGKNAPAPVAASSTRGEWSPTPRK